MRRTSADRLDLLAANSAPAGRQDRNVLELPERFFLQPAPAVLEFGTVEVCPSDVLSACFNAVVQRQRGRLDRERRIRSMRAVLGSPSQRASAVRAGRDGDRDRGACSHRTDPIPSVRGDRCPMLPADGSLGVRGARAFESERACACGGHRSCPMEARLLRHRVHGGPGGRGEAARGWHRPCAGQEFRHADRLLEAKRASGVQVRRWWLTGADPSLRHASWPLQQSLTAPCGVVRLRCS